MANYTGTRKNVGIANVGYVYTHYTVKVICYLLDSVYA